MFGDPAYNQDEFGLVLHVCLESIENGEESIESILPRYPEIKDLLRPPLEAALWLYKRSWLFDPNPAFVVTSRYRLVSQFKSEMNIPFSSRRIQQTSLSPTNRKWNTLSFVVFLGTVVLLVLTGLKSIGFWIGNSLPGDPLYRLKLTNEQLQLTISFSEEKDAQLSIQYVERRMVETERMILSDHERFLPLAILQFETQLNQAKQTIRVLTEKDPQEGRIYSQRLADVVHMQANKLEALNGFYPEELQKLINRVLQITSERVQIRYVD